MPDASSSSTAPRSRREPGAGERLARNAAANFAGQAILLGLSFFATPYLVHHFGARRYGVLALSLGLVSLLSLFELGFNSGLVKFLAASLARERRADAESYLRTGVALYLALGASVAVAAAWGARWAVHAFFHLPGELSGEAAAGIELGCVAFLARFSAGAFSAVPIAAERFGVVNAVFVSTEAARISASVLAVALHPRPSALVSSVLLVNVATNVLFFIASLWAARRILPGVRLWPSVSRRHLADLILFSKFAAPSQIASRAGNGLDSALLAHLLPVEFVAFYVVPSALCFKIWTLVGNVTSVVFPAASALDASAGPARVRELYLRANKFVLALAALPALALLLLGRQVLALWIGPEFARQGSTALALLSAGVLVNCLMHVPDALANGLGRPSLSAGFNIAETTLKFGLFFLLVPRMGVAGASAAYLAAQVLLVPWYVRAAGRMTGTGWRELFSRAYRPAIIPAAAASLVLAAWRTRIGSFTDLVFALASAGAVYALFGVYFILDSRERLVCFMLARRAGLARRGGLPARGAISLESVTSETTSGAEP